MVEQILNLSSVEFYTELYEKFFKGKLLLFAVHPVGNFILQRVITNVKEKEHVRLINILMQMERTKNLSIIFL
jgi:hypothetical protein